MGRMEETPWQMPLVFVEKSLTIRLFKGKMYIGIVYVGKYVFMLPRFMDNRHKAGEKRLRLMALFVKLFFAPRGRFSVTNCTWVPGAHPVRLC